MAVPVVLGVMAWIGGAFGFWAYLEIDRLAAAAMHEIYAAAILASATTASVAGSMLVGFAFLADWHRRSIREAIAAEAHLTRLEIRKLPVTVGAAAAADGRR
jgi:hypothetical protein